MVARSGRIYRLVRKAARAQWYVPFWLYLAWAPAAIAVVFWLGLEKKPLAWVCAIAAAGYFLYLARRVRNAEVTFWNARKDLAVWFEGGRLIVRSASATDSIDLSAYLSVDAVIERGRVVRLLADRSNDERDIYAGYDDMESFATEFCANARNARFRRVRLAFPMKLKEI